MAEYVFIRGWVSNINASGQKYVRLIANNADGKGFWTDDKSLVRCSDVARVVQCKDCKHYEIHKPKVLENCERNGYLIPMKPDDFCSYGERKCDD